MIARREFDSPRCRYGICVVDLLYQIADGSCREMFVAVFLDVRGFVIGYEIVALGTLTGVEVHPRAQPPERRLEPIARR